MGHGQAASPSIPAPAEWVVHQTQQILIYRHTHRYVIILYVIMCYILYSYIFYNFSNGGISGWYQRPTSGVGTTLNHVLGQVLI